MQALDHPSGGVHRAGPPVVRLLRSVCFVVLANPLAFAVAGTCVWLTAHLLLGIHHARVEGIEWELSDVLSCGSCIVALLFLACVAIGHIVLMLIAGWRGRES